MGNRKLKGETEFQRTSPGIPISKILLFELEKAPNYESGKCRFDQKVTALMTFGSSMTGKNNSFTHWLKSTDLPEESTWHGTWHTCQVIRKISRRPHQKPAWGLPFVSTNDWLLQDLPCRCKHAENWIKYYKQEFLSTGQQAK